MISLPPIFDNNAANGFYDSVRAQDMAQGIELDASQVGRMSSLAVQVLLSLEKSLAQHGKALKVSNASKDFCDIIHDLGLDDSLSRWGCR